MEKIGENAKEKTNINSPRIGMAEETKVATA